MNKRLKTTINMLLKSIKKFFGLTPKPVIEVDDDRIGNECVFILNAISTCRNEQQFKNALMIASRFERDYPGAYFYLNLLRDQLLETETKLLIA